MPVPLGIKPGHRARASRRRLSPSRTILLAALAIVLSSVAGGLAYFIPAAQTAIASTGQAVHVPSPSPTSLFTASPSPAPVANVSGAFTVLLLGSDDDSKFGPDHVLTQSMILVRVVPSTKQVTMLSIPRDLYVPMSVGWSGKIDGAYSYGGAGAAIATVEQNFHVHVDDYIWVGLLGLIKLIDAMGGVDVVTSNPEYVRSRHGDLQSDLGRSQRQQQVLIAIRQKARQIAPADLPVMASAIGGELKTSISISKVAELLPLASSFDNPDSIHQIVLLNPYTHGGGPDGSIVGNWDLILPLVHQTFP
ncbi:MAG: LytR family transcriptional regulator [Chloroflexi bacterium]|nr:MAG: LytR family transcriptional regulator [Chloroflexota bacterium]